MCYGGGGEEGDLRLVTVLGAEHLALGAPYSFTCVSMPPGKGAWLASCLLFTDNFSSRAPFLKVAKEL